MNVLTYIYEKTKKYHFTLFVAFVLFIFILVASYVYKRVFVPKENVKLFSDVANARQEKSVIDIYFFSVDWCPHCKTAKPEWDQFKRQYNNTVVNGWTIKCYTIDCTDDNGEQVIQIDNSDPSNPSATGIKPTSVKTADLIRKYKIEGYPTIKMMKENIVVDFDAKVTQKSLASFVNTVTSA